MSTTLFYAGPDTTYFDPFEITSTNVTDNYNLFYDVNGEFTVPVDGGTSSFVANPLFCDYPNSFELTNVSPCINAGDPASPLDPDNSRNDIGAKYYQTPCAVGTTDLTNVLNSFAIYPNPATEILNISFRDTQTKNQHIQLFNALGMMVKEFEITTDTPCNIANLPHGLYVVCMKNYPQLSQKFIKL